MRRLRIGMIGAGFIGQLAHLMNLVEVPNCEVVALAELRPELREKVARRYDIPKTYRTHEELLGDSEVEAAVVVTPRRHTAPVVLDCLRAGKHVLSEKPMAGSVAQGRQLLAAAREAGVHYAVGYMKRYDEGVQQARALIAQLVESGELGPIQFARAHCFMGDSYCKADGHVRTTEVVDYTSTGWADAPEDYPPNVAAGFAFYLNTYSHNTNLLRYLIGRQPSLPSVHLASGSPPTAAHLAVLDFGSFRATLETGRSSSRDWDERTEIYFADGRLTLDTPPALLKNVPARLSLYKAGTQQLIQSPQCDWTWAFRRQAQAFVRDIIEGTASLASAEDALLDLELIETMWRTRC